MFHDNQEVPNINGYQQINWVFHVVSASILHKNSKVSKTISIINGLFKIFGQRMGKQLSVLFTQLTLKKPRSMYLFQAMVTMLYIYISINK